jgi:hypothetical protein
MMVCLRMRASPWKKRRVIETFHLRSDGEKRGNDGGQDLGNFINAREAVASSDDYLLERANRGETTLMRDRTPETLRQSSGAIP